MLQPGQRSAWDVVLNDPPHQRVVQRFVQLIAVVLRHLQPHIVLHAGLVAAQPGGRRRGAHGLAQHGLADLLVHVAHKLLVGVHAARPLGLQQLDHHALGHDHPRVLSDRLQCFQQLLLLGRAGAVGVLAHRCGAAELVGEGQPEGDAVALEEHRPEQHAAHAAAVGAVVISAAPVHDELAVGHHLAGEHVLAGQQAQLVVHAKYKAARIAGDQALGQHQAVAHLPHHLAHRKALERGLQQALAHVVEAQVLQPRLHQLGGLDVGGLAAGGLHIPRPAGDGQLALGQHRAGVAVALQLVIDLEALAAAPGLEGVVLIGLHAAVEDAGHIALDAGDLLRDGLAVLV